MNFRLSNKADWQRLVAYVRGLPWQRDGKQVMYRVTVEELRPQRSVLQNARYWSLLTAISQQAPQHMGGEYHSREVWHEYLAGRFLGFEAGPFGQGVRKRTSKLKVGEFADYMQEIEAWAYTELPGFEFERRAA